LQGFGEVISKGYENALLLVTKMIDKVITGEIQVEDLVVSKLLRQDLTKYRNLFPHVSAALQLARTGKSLTRGDIIQYIYTDAAHTNPLRRVMPLDHISEEHDYDKEKYREMLLEAEHQVKFPGRQHIRYAVGRYASFHQIATVQHH
jgi:DNA polymerase elongation subunit (family B)